MTYTVIDDRRYTDARVLTIRITDDAGKPYEHEHYLSAEERAAVAEDERALAAIVVKAAANGVVQLEYTVASRVVPVKAEPAALATLTTALTPERVEERVTEVREVLVYAERLREEGGTEEEISVALREREAAWDRERVGVEEPVRELAGTVTR